MRSRTGATKIICFLGIVACCLLQLTAAVQGVSAAPKQVPGAKAGDCGACHGKDKVLPDSHPVTKAMDWKGCKACHQGDKMALAGKMPGSHVHQLTGVNCVGCHGKTEKPARKVGHVTIRASTEAEREARVAQVLQVMQETTS